MLTFIVITVKPFTAKTWIPEEIRWMEMNTNEYEYLQLLFVLLTRINLQREM